MDEIAAMLAISKIRVGNPKSEKQPIRYYYCEMCQGWHLTSQKIKYDKSTTNR